MQDQVEQLKHLGEKRVVALNSFLSAGRKTLCTSLFRAVSFYFYFPRNAVTAASTREAYANGTQLNRSR